MSYSRRHTRITYEGFSFLSILAFIVLGSIMRQINLLVLLSGLMIAPFFFNWRISMKMMERLVLRRRIPQWVHAGSPFTLAWQIQNHRRRIPSWGIRVVDCLRYQGMTRKQAEQINLVARAVEPQSSVQVTCQCLLPQRGIGEFGPAEGSSAFPVGLIRSRIYCPRPETIFVAPRLGKMTSNWSRFATSVRDGNHSSQRRQNSSDEQIYAIRPWQSGDTRRLIHWRSSAKQGELMVRQFDQQTDRKLAIALDLHAGSATPGEIEMAASFMATALHHASLSRMRAASGFFGDQQLVLKPATRDGNFQAMRMLATIQASADNGLLAGLSKLVGDAGQAFSLIVISTRGRHEAIASASPDDARLAENSHWIDVRSDDCQRYFVPSTDTSQKFLQDSMNETRGVSG